MSSEARPHSGWVKFLTILVGLFGVIAILTSWLDSQLLDTEQWGQTSVEMLQNPEIRSAVASYAVEELYRNVDVEAEIKSVLPSDFKGLSGIAAGGLRQVADQGAEQALALPQIQDVWQRANIAAHRTLMDVIDDKSQVLTTGGGQVDLQLRPLIIEIAAQIGLATQAEQNVPASVGSVRILDSSELSTVQTVAGAIQGSALIFSLLVVLLVGLALYLSKGYRWITLLWLAGALILAAAIVLVLRASGSGFVVAQLATPDLEAAASAAYAIGTDLLKSFAWSVMIAAFVMVFLAWLVSPNSAAQSARQYLAVAFGRFPAITFGLLGLAALVFLLFGVSDGRSFIVRLAIVVLVGIASIMFRRQLIAEYPDADFSSLRDFGTRTKEQARGLWDRRPREIPGKSALERRRAESASRNKQDAEAPTAVVSAQGGEQTRLEQLEKLGKLHETGILSDDEFAAEKTRILELPD